MQFKAEYRHPGFAETADYYYREMISRNPVKSTWLGEHDFDGLLPETGADAVEKNIAFLRDMKNSFSRLPENELSFDEQIDRASMLYHAEQNLFADEDLQRWKTGKDLAMIIGESLFLLFSRDFAPLSDRVQSMISRLRAVPLFLMGSKSLFQKVPVAYGEIYLESLDALPVLIDNIAACISRSVPAVLVTDYHKAATEAKRAASEFSCWLRQAILPRADSPWNLGQSSYNALISTKAPGLNVAELLENANMIMQRSSEQLENLSCLILGIATGSATGARTEVQKRIAGHAPASFAMTMEVFREAVNRSRAFIETSGFATLPESETVDILPTPVFMTHLVPISAYIAAEKTSQQQRGIYLLTDRGNDTAARHSYASLVNSAIHEIYPGHHLQFSMQNQHPGKMRVFCENLELIEGWAAYCQHRVREMGFETSHESLFAHAKTEIFEASRLVVEINVQTGQWNKEQATDYLSKKNEISRSVAEAEIKRIILNPGHRHCSIAGAVNLLKLKNRLAAEFGKDLSDRDFHDMVLFNGAVPLHVASSYYPKIHKNKLLQKTGY